MVGPTRKSIASDRVGYHGEHMFDSSAGTSTSTVDFGLTDRQQAVLDVVRAYASEHGYPPTVREIGATLGLTSSSTVHSHLAALERAGIVERDPTKPRALTWGPAAIAAGVEVADGGFGSSSTSTSTQEQGFDVEPSVALPLVGRVAAGAPITAHEHVEQYLPVPKPLTRNGTSFVLKVRGDSMIDAGIFDGDWVVVRQQPECRPGEIVVALVGDEHEATCKRFERGADGRIELHSENAAYEPIIPDQCEIAGVVTGVMRAI